MDLNDAKQALNQRFVNPTLATLKKSIGPSMFNTGYDLALLINWKPIEQFFLNAKTEFTYAEKCIELLQTVQLWDGLKKGIMRYLSEDKQQLNLFCQTVKQIVIEFGKTDATDLAVASNALKYHINILNANFFSTTMVYDRLAELMDVIADQLKGNKMEEELKKAEQKKKELDKRMGDDMKINTKTNVWEGFDDEFDVDEVVEEANSSPTAETTTTTTVSKNNVSDAQESGSKAAASPSEDFFEDELLTNLNPKLRDTMLNEFKMIGTGRALDDLKLLARQPRVLAGDLTALKLYMKHEHDKFWKASDAEDKLISLVRKEAKKASIAVCEKLKQKEYFIKSWVITKVNIQGMNQERILVLTTHRMYTGKVAKDKENAYCDPSHLKYYDLSRYSAVDIARFKPTATQKVTPFGLAIYFRDPQKEAKYQMKRSASFSATKAPPPMLEKKEEQPEEAPKKKKKGIAGKLDKIVRKGSVMIKNAFKNDDEDKDEKKKERERPPVEEMLATVYMAPENIHIADFQQRYLAEVGWLTYAAALALRKSSQDCYEPYDDYLIKRPEGNVGSFLYNKLGLGKADKT